jgi:phosphoribosylanthranilate isomerase
MPRTRIKVCGITEITALQACAHHGVDAIGFVFAADSPRVIDPEDAFALTAHLPALMSTVGVFRDLDVDAFCDIEEICPTIYSQLHGEEDIDTVVRCGPDIIKGIAFDPKTIGRELMKWASVDEVCAILIDAKTPGAGEAFDWEQLKPSMSMVNKPIIIAGGLTPENVGACIRTLRPFGVDVSSGVESARGVKDVKKIATFCEAVQRADAS